MDMDLIMKRLRRLRALFRKEELNQELSDELSFHLRSRSSRTSRRG
jgi:hypothetical protein